jgi:DNA-binding Lrp family transcriptional regulator
MSKADITARRDAIVRVLIEDFVGGNADGMSIRDIADRIDSTPTKVSHACEREFEVRGWSRITYVRVTVPVRDRNYGMIRHYRECAGYKVSAPMLREIIATMRMRDPDNVDDIIDDIADMEGA